MKREAANPKARKINPQVNSAKQIRASVITKWLKMPAGRPGGYNLREVQNLAGYRYLNSTERYLQSKMEDLKEEVQQYHQLG